MSQLYATLKQMMQQRSHGHTNTSTRSRVRSLCADQYFHRADIQRFITCLFFSVAIYLLFIAPVFADEMTPMGEVLCDVWSWMYGNMGRGLGTIAILVVGIGAVLGKTSWGLAITVGVGISVLFNADSIVKILGLGTVDCDA